MADTKISELPAASIPDLTETVPVVQLGVTKKLTLSQLISPFGATLVDDADAATARTTLGLGSAATTDSGDYATSAHTHAQLHDAVTVSDSTSIDLTLTGQQISAAAIFGTTSGTVCQGNDSRVTGALQPITLPSGAIYEKSTAVAASAIDVSAGAVFTKTISGATTFTVSNVPASGTTASFVLELTNGGSAVVTWWAGMTWAGGTPPTLTASGVDVLGFYTQDGGTTWRGLVLGLDVKAPA